MKLFEIKLALDVIVSKTRQSKIWQSNLGQVDYLYFVSTLHLKIPLIKVNQLSCTIFPSKESVGCSFWSNPASPWIFAETTNYLINWLRGKLSFTINLYPECESSIDYLYYSYSVMLAVTVNQISAQYHYLRKQVWVSLSRLWIRNELGKLFQSLLLISQM